MKNRDEDDSAESSQLEQGGEIWVHEFTEKSAAAFRRQVLSEVERTGPEKPITIYIDSYGGYADSLAVMLATLDEIPNAVITVAVGKAMSCGAILLSHGDGRFCEKYARVMVHEISCGTYGNIKTLVNDTKEAVRLNKLLMELLAKNCGMKSYEELKQRLKENDADEIWMSAEDAKAFGIVDQIGMPKIVSVHNWQCMLPAAKPPRWESVPANKKEEKPKPKRSIKGKKKKSK